MQWKDQRKVHNFEVEILIFRLLIFYLFLALIYYIHN
jgi:hypothetical protein